MLPGVQKAKACLAAGGDGMVNPGQRGDGVAETAASGGPGRGRNWLTRERRGGLAREQPAGGTSCCMGT